MSDVDVKAGYSTACRGGQHISCRSARLRCTCDCHGKGGQMPPKTTKTEPAPPPAPEANGKSTTGIVWEEPPTRSWSKGTLRDRLAPQLAELRRHPGRWARIATYDKKSSASTAAMNLRKKPPAGKWEFRSARIDGGSGLYARYAGEGAE